MPQKTIKVPAFQPGDILYIGNQDNLGFMFVKHARDRGLRAWLIMQGRGINRSDPDYLCKGLYEKYKNYILPSEAFIQIVKFTKEFSGLNILSTGIEIMFMLEHSNNENNYYIVPTGSDLAMWPFVDEKTAALSQYLRYRDIFYSYRSRLKGIFTSQLDCIYSSIALGLKDKIIPWLYPVPLEFLDQQSPFYIVDSNKADYDSSKRLIFLPCRKNGDKKYTHYKGVKLIIDGLEKFCQSASKEQIECTRIMNVDHSNRNLDYGCAEFKKDLHNLSVQYNLKVRNMRNLKASEFWSFVLDPRISVIDQFGQFHGLMGGIGREACCAGTPFLTGSLSASDMHTKSFYGDDPPIFTASSSSEIAQFIHNFTSLSDIKLSELRGKIAGWARIVFDPSQSFDKILERILN